MKGGWKHLSAAPATTQVPKAFNCGHPSFLQQTFIRGIPRQCVALSVVSHSHSVYSVSRNIPFTNPSAETIHYVIPGHKKHI